MLTQMKAPEEYSPSPGCKVWLYDLKRAPFSQGYAVMEIMKSIRGKLIAAGDVITPPMVFENGGEAAGMIYIKSVRGGGVAESVWLDDGLSVQCQAFRLQGGDWERTKISQRA